MGLKLTSVHTHAHTSANRAVLYASVEILDSEVTAVSWRWMDPCIHSRLRDCSKGMTA